MKTNIVVRVFAGLSVAVLCLITLAPSAHATCGPRIPSGLAPLAGDQAMKADSESVAARAASAAVNSGQVVGLWLVTITVDGQPFGQAFESFTSDGLEVLNDSGPPQAGNVCLGAWIPTSRSSIRITHPSWNYDDQGNAIGTVVLVSEITLQSANSYKGKVTVTTYDLNGNAVGPALVAQLSATRIKP